MEGMPTSAALRIGSAFDLLEVLEDFFGPISV